VIGVVPRKRGRERRRRKGERGEGGRREKIREAVRLLSSTDRCSTFIPSRTRIREEKEEREGEKKKEVEKKTRTPVSLLLFNRPDVYLDVSSPSRRYKRAEGREEGEKGGERKKKRDEREEVMLDSPLPFISVARKS